MEWFIIKTYQDLLAVGENESARMQFVLDAIREHKASLDYQTAVDAELYFKHQNPTIMRYQKFLHNRFGQKVPDIWSPNNKIASNWYYYFTTQAVQYLLGNGVTFGKEDTKDKLGKNFDHNVIKAARAAKHGGVSFGFWNYDHIDVFALTEFVPLWDEEDGSLKAGIRYWQIDDKKPLRATLYELDGLTDYIKRKDEEISIREGKHAYKRTTLSVGGVVEEVIPGGNYSGFPIVPLWNINKQSDLVGTRGTIDAYDLMISGLINNVSEGEFIYWVLKNCGGMSEEDDIQFIEQLRLTHVAHADGDDGAGVESEKISVPFEASETSLKTLRTQLYDDFMGLDVKELGGGEKTATEIEAAYEPLNQKTDDFEFGVTEFILGILELAGIEDAPTYTRSKNANRKESVETVLSAAEYLDDEYMTKKILTELGDADEVDEVMSRKIADAAARYTNMGNIDDEEE